MTMIADHDAYIAAAPKPFQPSLERLRALLACALAEAEEVVAYNMQGFRIGGSVVAGYAACSKQCGLYILPGAISEYAKEITTAGLKAAKTGITFSPRKLLPDVLFFYRTTGASFCKERQGLIEIMQNDRKPAASPINDHECKFRSVSPEARRRLEAIQTIVEQRVTDTERCVSYGMPAFRKGKVFFYFASFNKHVGVYPPVTEPKSLIAELADYRGPKGNLIFPHNKPLPIQLIGHVAEALARQYAVGDRS